MIFLILLAPLSRVLAYNWSYFDASLFEIVLAVLIVSGLCNLVLLPFYFGKVLRSRLVDFLSFVFVTVVVIVHFLPISLSAIDGGETVDFVLRKEAYYLLIIGFLLFAIYLMLGYLKHPLSERIKGGVSVLVMLASFYVVAFTVYAASKAPSYLAFTGELNENYELPVSRQENIFIIGFDQVQGSLMHGLLRSDSYLAGIFDGFTFYSDAAATYPNTNYSLSSIVLGRPAARQSEYYKAVADSSDSLLVKAKDRGFSVFTSNYNTNTVSECLTCAVSNNASYNWIEVHEAFRHSLNLAFGLDLNRFLPLASSLTGSIPSDMLELAWKLDLHRFESLANNLVVKDNKPALYFLHFLGTHQPFSYDSTCQVYSKEALDTNQNPAGAIDSSKCAIQLLNDFFSSLKKFGLYESSTIIIYSDHGYEENINKFANLAEYANYFSSTADVLGDERNIKSVGSYNPALFYKPAGSTGDLFFNAAPVSLIDIAPTVCSLIGCDDDWHGMNLSTGSKDIRQREFWLYLGGRGRRAADGRDKLHDGLEDFWEKRSFAGQIYPNLAFAMGLSEDQFNRVLNLQYPVAFTKDGDSNTYIMYGWSDQESTHRWTEGSKASLQFRLQNFDHRDLVLRLNANGYLSGGLPHQKVGFSINGSKVAEWQVAGPAIYEAVIPAGLVAEDGTINLAFDISDPRAPCDVSESKDCRKLGMAVRELVIDYAQ